MSEGSDACHGYFARSVPSKRAWGHSIALRHQVRLAGQSRPSPHLLPAWCACRVVEARARWSCIVKTRMALSMPNVGTGVSDPCSSLQRPSMHSRLTTRLAPHRTRSSQCQQQYAILSGLFGRIRSGEVHGTIPFAPCLVCHARAQAAPVLDSFAPELHKFRGGRNPLAQLPGARLGVAG